MVSITRKADTRILSDFRQKRKELRKKRRRENKRKQQEEKVDWQMNHIYLLASDIVEYIKDEPLFALNYKQMLLSDGESANFAKIG